MSSEVLVGFKMVSISTEFLEELQLTHLGNYLRVLGCTCVRDLRLLEEPELNAIQLISRRRLLKRLESLSLHHEGECVLCFVPTLYGCEVHFHICPHPETFQSCLC